MNTVNILSKVKPWVKLLWYIEDTPRIVSSAGKQTLLPREFLDIYNKMTQEKIEKWITEMIKRGHGSPLEHSLYIFEIQCSRVTSHQLVRHRIASYTQLSQRRNDKYFRSMISRAAEVLGLKNPGKNDYRGYIMVLEKTLTHALDFWTLLDIIGEAYIVPPGIIEREDERFLYRLIEATIEYYNLLEKGVSYEDSRFIIPQAVKTRILVSMNARELLESFLPLRMCSHAQWEIRYIAWNLWRQLVEVHPEIFKYTGPRCILYDNRIRTTPCMLKDYLNGDCKPIAERCPELVPRDGILDCIRYASKDPWDIGGRK